MNYNKTSATIAKLQINGLTFNFDSNVQDFSVLGIEPTQEMIEAEEQRALNHGIILADFDSDERNIGVFARLLSEDPNTAFVKYLSGLNN